MLLSYLLFSLCPRVWRSLLGVLRMSEECCEFLECLYYKMEAFNFLQTQLKQISYLIVRNAEF